jgi:3-oxoacyl-[acyl-carrier protein] reductase
MAHIELNGKTAIVTGAGSGLGRAMTLGLAGRGAAIAALDVNESDAAETAGMAAKSVPGARVRPIAVDVRRRDQVERAVEQARRALGGPHVLVNCAGIGMAYLRRDYVVNPLRFWEADPDRWQDVIDVNVRGPCLMARAVAPHLLAQGWGRIVNVSTSFNTMIRPANMPYGMSKAAIEAASAAWAGELAGTGVTVNVLIPGGAADTAMVPPESPYDRSALTRPEVMVAPICFLASDASNGVSGVRFIGREWDASLPPEEAMKKAGAPIAWPDLAEAAATGQPTPKGGFAR